MTTQLDHLVIAAENLQEGIAYIRDQLGVDIPAGGKHLHMGTHNHVMQLGNGTYLEVISIDPDGATPPRPRWFDLDNPLMRERLQRGPALIHWVVNTPSFSNLPDFNPQVWGIPQLMQRDNLRWLFALPEDGHLPGAGLIPTVIEWQCQQPSTNMANRDCVLKELRLLHPQPQWLARHLKAIAADVIDSVEVTLVQAPHCSIEVGISTPSGLKVLSSH
ncbi:MAG: hypothetical protein ACI8P9_001545 [Parasphingorhabdus sp.]|jgi:hypothetical protein